MNSHEAHFRRLIKDWTEVHRRSLSDHLAWYSSAKDIDEAIIRAAKAERGPDGKRASHQYRLPKCAIGKIKLALNQAKTSLRDCADFSELYENVRSAIGGICNVGPLMIYDTALRVGAFLNISPDSVYLHRGALDGARVYMRVIKSNAKTGVGESLSTDAFPHFSQKLNAAEIENFLCTMKDRIDPNSPYKPAQLKPC